MQCHCSLLSLFLFFSYMYATTHISPSPSSRKHSTLPLSLSLSPFSVSTILAFNVTKTQSFHSQSYLLAKIPSGSPPKSFNLVSSPEINLMKKLIRRLSRVADSSHYSLLRSETQTPRPRSMRRSETSKPARRARGAKAVPEGHVPVYVGDEMERFVVTAELLNHPVFVNLLEKSAQEYGYEQKGVLRIPCHVLVFERLMEALRLGLESRDIEDILGFSLFA